MAQYVYTMQGVTKVVPPQRTILQNINLSFFPGAKIGVLGLNGSGKSSLLRIMAGQDTEIDGEARAQKDIRVGYLPQEPALDDTLDVRGNVELGVAEIMSVLNEYNDISERFAEPMDDDEMTRLLERQGDLATQIDAVEGWEIDRTLDIAADALRLPTWETPGCQPFRGGAPPGGSLRPTALQARHAAARRTDQPFGRRKCVVARALLRRVSGYCGGSYPRPLFLG
jgi:ATPase subunit of ABC transporter with duplicated ATPase domains